MGIKRRALLGWIVAPLLVLSGCFWPAPGGGPDRRAHNDLEDKITPSTVADLDVIWEAALGGSVGDPSTSNTAVHASASGGLYGIDSATGDQLWVFRDPDFPDFIDMGPAVFDPDTVWSTDEDVLWVGYGIGNLGGNYVTRLLDAATGELLGAMPDGGGLVDGVRGDRYLLRSISFGSLTPIALNMQVGGPEVHELWSATIAIREFGDPGWSAFTLGDDHVYQAGFGVLTQDGTPRWDNGVRGYEIGEAPACPPPGEILTCATWETPLEGSTATSPVLTRDGSTLFTATDAGAVHAVDAMTGGVLWSTPVGSAVEAEPALADGSLFVPTADGRLVVLDAADGSLLWEAQAGDAVREQPAVAGGLVFTGARDGSVRAFEADGCGAATCDPLWSASTESSISGAPAVSNGRLYVGTSDGRLVAYGLP